MQQQYLIEELQSQSLSHSLLGGPSVALSLLVHSKLRDITNTKKWSRLVTRNVEETNSDPMGPTRLFRNAATVQVLGRLLAPRLVVLSVEVTVAGRLRNRLCAVLLALLACVYWARKYDC
jgi:hypothetical protein